MVMQGCSVLIWDCADSPLAHSSDQIVLWRSYGEAAFPFAVSIPKLVEQNAIDLRRRYVAWVYDLGLNITGRRRWIDHLQLRPNFSYWWMTLFAEKSSWGKSPIISDAIRLFAFENWVMQLSCISSIRLVSSNKALTGVLKSWCILRGVDFQLLPSSDLTKKNIFKKGIVDTLPHALLAAAWLLKYLIQRWPLRNVGLDRWHQSSGKTTFITYLFNLVPEAVQGGRSEDYYWTRLPEVLDENDIDSCWLYIYVKSSVLPDARSAANLLNRFNETHRQHRTHVALDSFLSINVVFNTLLDYYKVCLFGRLKGVIFSQQYSLKKLSIESRLLPLFSKDWDNSFFGVAAISNLLMLNLFERAFSHLPRQQMGLYLQENQGWEFAMIHAWRLGQHDKLIGFPHSTIQFWNLSYFFDSRIFSNKELELPRPNFVAVCGDLVKSALVNGGHPKEELIEVEALRYLHLNCLKKNISSHRSPSKRLRVLVLGDYLPKNTYRQLDILRGLSSHRADISWTVKPHPACPVCPADYSDLKFELSCEPISELLSQFYIAYTSSATSAAVDAYCAGLKVISVLDPEMLNLSPLRGVAGVAFVSSPEQLLDVLERIDVGPPEGENVLRFYNTDPSLSGWKSLLSVPRRRLEIL